MVAKVILYDMLKDDFRVNSAGLLERYVVRYNPKWHLIKNVSNGSRGYCKVRWHGMDFQYHRIFWVIYYKQDLLSDVLIDHIDGDKLNNYIDNLRVTTHRGNQQNRKKHRFGHLVGVSWIVRDQKWACGIHVKAKRVFLGYYASAEEAHAVYCVACKLVPEYKNNVQFRRLVYGSR